MLLDIELKGPSAEEWVEKYDHNLAAQKVVDMIGKYKIAKKTMVSSFTPRILESILLATKDTEREFIL